MSKRRFAVVLKRVLQKTCAPLLAVCLAAIPASAAWAQAPAASPPAAPTKPAEAKPAEPAAEEPVPEEPVAPKKEVNPAYLTIPVIAALRDDFPKDPDKDKDRIIRDERARFRRLRDDIHKDERGDRIKDPKDAADFDKYYTRFIFAEMTQPQRATEFAKDRQAFFLRHMGVIKNKDVHDRLVKLARETMLPVAQQNYHPAARYNAMLIIGDLNALEAVKGGGATPAAPEPLTKPALADMLRELASPTQIDAVRVACLVGILRHAEMDGQKQDLQQRWPPPIKMAVIEPMLALLNTKDPPQGRTAEGHLWMQRRAIDVLGALGDHGTEGAVAKKLEAFVGDEAAPIALRCTAAVALGRINNLVLAKIQPGDAAKKLADLALQAGRDELARLETEKKHRDELLKPLADEAGGYPASGGRSPMGGYPRAGSGGGYPRSGGTGRPPGMSSPPMPGPSRGPMMPRPSSGGARGFQRGDAGGAPTLPGPGGGPGQRYPAAGGATPRTSVPGRPPGYPGTGRGPMDAMGGMGGTGEDLIAEIEYREKYKIELACRRLKYHLSCVKTGLEGTPSRKTSGLKEQFPDPYKSYIEQVVSKIDEMAKVDEPEKGEKASDKVELKLETLIKKLSARVAELDTVARAVTWQPAQAPAAAPADAPADGPGADGPDGPSAPAAKPAASKPGPANGP